MMSKLNTSWESVQKIYICYRELVLVRATEYKGKKKPKIIPFPVHDFKPKLFLVQVRKRSLDFIVADTKSPKVGPQKMLQ